MDMMPPLSGLPGAIVPAIPLDSPLDTGDSLCKVWIKHLFPAVSPVQIGVYFSSFGVVVDCDVVKNATGKCSGIGYVVFNDEESAQQVLLKPHVFQGRKISVHSAIEFEQLPEFRDVVSGLLSFHPPPESLEDFFEEPYGEGANSASPHLAGIRNPPHAQFNGHRALRGPPPHTALRQGPPQPTLHLPNRSQRAHQVGIPHRLAQLGGLGANGQRMHQVPGHSFPGAAWINISMYKPPEPLSQLHLVDNRRRHLRICGGSLGTNPSLHLLI
eukprot:TRINITY_DN18441_c0_g1_i2.p1 TRINITY_DN18441_c0_g1~~TRINITY_DN18441_c0_g1_i2.p1  ORF type:complete len:271 (-),score=16.21 TRINITY_DN18441_c0_g1_i2:454-1266(-)